MPTNTDKSEGAFWEWWHSEREAYYRATGNHLPHAYDIYAALAWKAALAWQAESKTTTPPNEPNL